MGQAIDPNIEDEDSDSLNDGGQVTDQKIEDLELVSQQGLKMNDGGQESGHRSKIRAI